MRIALIGLGAAGRSHLEVLLGMPEVELAGIADLDEGLVRERCGEFGLARGTTNPAELIGDPSIPAIAIAAGDRAHHPLVMACAKAGKHVCIEKPLATEVGHCREMVDAMAAAGKLLCVTFNNRAGSHTVRIKELVDAGAIGTLRMVRLIGLMAAPDNLSVRQRFGEDAARKRLVNICEDGKNALFDCGVHSFDYARHLTGCDFAKIEAMGYSMRGLTYPDHGVAMCAMTNGVFVLIEKGFDYAFEAQRRKEYVRYEAIGDEGSLAWDLDTQHLLVFGQQQTLDEHLPHGGKGNVRELLYRGFIESVEAGELQSWLASGEDGLAATAAAQVALESMQAKGVLTRAEGPARNWWEA